MPLKIAVYGPGLSVARIADSRSLVGARPVAWIAACWVSFQLSLVIVVKPPNPCSSITGSASGSGTPKAAKEGPIPRRSTVLGAVPVIMNPPMPTLASVSTRRRVERLTGCAAAVGLGVMLGVGVVVGVGVGVSTGTVAVGVAVNVAVGVGPGTVAVAVAVAVGVGDGDPQAARARLARPARDPGPDLGSRPAGR